MKSIQTRLTRWLALSMTVLSTLTGGILFLSLRHTIIKEFDHSLSLRAQALKSLISQKADGKLDVDFNAAIMPEYNGSSFKDYFRISSADGATIAASTAQPIDLHEPSQDGVAWDLNLPMGVRARAIRTQFLPQPEINDEDPPAHSSASRKLDRAPLTLIVTRDRHPLDAELLRISVLITVATTALSIAAMAATVLVVRRGLATLRDLASEAAAIDFTRSDAKFDSGNLPSELTPIAARLNEMLHRVAVMFARERRFTADVAHELRTPIAELRLAADIALRGPIDPQLTHRTAVQARDIASQMQAMVTTLLSIARQESSDQPLILTPVDLPRLITRSITRYDALIEERCLTVTQSIEAPTVHTEAVMFAAVTDNLLSNAIRYAALGGRIEITAIENDRAVSLTIQNTQDTLTAEDLPRMFEPFWRKETARTGGDHVGLGLTLARSYCSATQIDLAITLPSSDIFCVTLTIPKASSSTTHSSPLTAGVTA